MQDTTPTALRFVRDERTEAATVARDTGAGPAGVTAVDGDDAAADEGACAEAEAADAAGATGAFADSPSVSKPCTGVRLLMTAQRQHEGVNGHTCVRPALIGAHALAGLSSVPNSCASCSAYGMQAWLHG